ncbi:hypothetical protein ACJX0J_032388, partial [Zea mays]
MAASGSGGNEPGGRPWTATSTWVLGPAGGTAEDAVSFETSDYDAEASPAGVVLCRPPADAEGDVHSCPCELTVSFRGKYEIHRVYVRSTARIYELYHSPDAKGTGKDYLCTVRCGLAVKEPQPYGEESMSQRTGSALNSAKREHEAKSVSSGSDEDSWVDVNIPESPAGNKTLTSQERNVIRTCQVNTMAHYEATAEMTDVNPCASLTIRLLSLQSNTSVHIEEIYIFADPVESTNDVSVRGPGNMGGSSLLAMLAPGLMQMSKSRNLKIDGSYFSDKSRDQDSVTCERVTQEAGLCSTNDSKYTSAGIESGMGPTIGVTVSDEKSSQSEFQFKEPNSLPLPVQTLDSTQAPSVKDRRELNTGHPLMNENFTPYNHIERKLDTLLSKVEKVELYCSRFEDSMIKPLGSIEARLQRLEEQFSSFSLDIQSLRGSSAFMSAPDGMPNTKSSQEEAPNDANDRSTSTTDRKPGLVVRAPDFMSDDSCGCNVITNGNQVSCHGPNVVPRLLVKVPDFISQAELTDGNLHDGHALSSEKECKPSPGLIVKVPEFLDDDDDDDDNDSDDEVEGKKQAEVCGDGDAHAWSDDTLKKNTSSNTKSKKTVSINGALASALEALLTSTIGPPSSKPAVCATSNLSAENINDSFSCSRYPGKSGEMPTKYGSVDQFLGTSGDPNLVGAFISFQDIDTTHNSLSKEMLDSEVEINEHNCDLNTEKVAFVAITEPLDVSSQTDKIDESICDGSWMNRQNNGSNFDTMPYIMNIEPLDPSKPPTVFGPVDSGVQVNEDRPSISLLEFLAARNANSCKNDTSEVCLGNEAAEKLSFERTSAGAGKNSKNTSQLLVKKALEIDADERFFLSSVPIGAKFERTSSPAPRTSGHDINNTKEAVSDKECGLEDRENGIRLSSRMDSIFSQCHATDSLSSLSSMESFSAAPATDPVVPGNDTSGNFVEDLAGIGDHPVATLISGEDLQKVCDLLYELKDDMLGMASTAKCTNKSSPSLEVLLAESSDSEVQISDLEEGIASGAGIGSAGLFGTFSSSDDDASAAGEPL